MGFCLLNNVAVAARWARAQGMERVLIVDWDVHHGNGTQDIFYNDPAVYYLSLHQYPLYPGTGFPDERGAGAALNTNRNVQVNAGTAGPAYLALLDAALVAVQAEFAPELVIVSGGFDCLRGDPLGGLHLEPADLHAATLRIREHCTSAEGRMVVALEGGYAPERTALGVVDVLRALCELPPQLQG
jgi:acetoin utilization deacetylase AcuC-like enzyme